MTDKIFVDSNVVIYGLNAALPQYRIATKLFISPAYINYRV